VTTATTDAPGLLCCNSFGAPPQALDQAFNRQREPDHASRT
jgi:hypothetical protein